MRGLRFGWMALIGITLMFSCGKRDDREDIRSRFGEPSAIQVLGRDIYYRELWLYNSTGFGYEFRRTAACGSLQETYLYSTFVFIPDSSGAGAQIRPPQNSTSNPPGPSNDLLFAPH